MDKVVVKMADRFFDVRPGVLLVNGLGADITDAGQWMVFIDLPARLPPTDPLGVGPPGWIKKVAGAMGKSFGLDQQQQNQQYGNGQQEFAVLQVDHQQSPGKKNPAMNREWRSGSNR